MPSCAGLYFDLAEDTYHANKAIGSTDVRELLKSGPDFWWSKHHRAEATTTPFFEAGKGFHKRVLEGEQSFRSNFIRRPDGIAKLTEKIKSEIAPNGETVLDQDGYDRIEISANMIASNPQLASAFSGGASEVSIFWTETVDGVEVPCKARFDYLKVRGIGDLKSFRNYRNLPFEEACTRAIVEHRYDIQAAHYLIGRRHLAEFVSHDLVFGDHEKDWLRQVAEQTEYAFQWIFVQADGAPMCWSRALSWGNPILDIAADARTKALQTYAAFSKQFGDERWTINAEVQELDINELPRWYR
jgi:hypothetical protein